METVTGQNGSAKQRLIDRFEADVIHPIEDFDNPRQGACLSGDG